MEHYISKLPLTRIAITGCISVLSRAAQAIPRGFRAGVAAGSVVMGVAFAVTPAHALVIDNFVTAQTSDTDAVPVATDFSSIAAPSALGGERDILVTKTAGADGDRIRARTNPFLENKLRFSQDDGVRGLAEIVYDGADNSSAINASGLGGLSLLADNATAFLLDITGSDVGGPIRVNVFEQGVIGNFVEGIFNVPGGILSGLPGDDITLSMLFSSMTVSGTSSLNDVLTNVGAISLLIDAQGLLQESWDLNVAFFRTNSIPEPGAILLFGAGIAGLGLLRRHRVA